MKILILLTTLTMFGCTEPMKPTEDNTFKEMRITVHTYRTRKALIKATKKYDTRDEIGLAVWNNKDNKCDIYVIEVKSKSSKQFETWGHELGHCIYGSFH